MHHSETCGHANFFNCAPAGLGLHLVAESTPNPCGGGKPMSVSACRVLFQHEVGFKTSKPESKAWKESSYNEEVLHPPVHSPGRNQVKPGRETGRLRSGERRHRVFRSRRRWGWFTAGVDCGHVCPVARQA